jgi:hypothetical protein
MTNRLWLSSLSSPATKVNCDKSIRVASFYALSQSPTSLTSMAHTSNIYHMTAYEKMIIPISGGRTNSALQREVGECGNDSFSSYPIATDTYFNRWVNFDVTTWHHYKDLFTVTNNRTMLHKVGNQGFTHDRQGHGNSQYSIAPTFLLESPTFHSKALVKRHHSSLE